MGSRTSPLWWWGEGGGILEVVESLWDIDFVGMGRMWGCLETHRCNIHEEFFGPIFRMNPAGWDSFLFG